MAGEDPGYVSWVRTRPCAVCGAHGVEAHHAGPRGLGQRAHDLTCIPLCAAHHRAWHDLGEPFRKMSRGARGAWAEATMRETRASYDDRLRETDIPF